VSKKRVVILYGAGAAVDFGGPTTPELTELVCQTGRKFLINEEFEQGKRVTEYIYETLKKPSRNHDLVNFESIISAVEELYNYYLHLSGWPKVPGVFHSLFELKNLVFGNFRLGEDGYLYLPKSSNNPYVLGGKLANTKQAEAKFFQLLQSEIQIDIIERIAQYRFEKTAHDTSKHVLIEDFKHWTRELSENRILRTYSLNYDNLFFDLDEDKELNYFDGFESEFDKRQNAHLPNPARIINDFESNVFYNLHGSALWNPYPRKSQKISAPFITKSHSPWFHFKNETVEFNKTEPTRPLILSNIITGGSKTQKMTLTPYRQMSFAFESDCFNADKIIVIGYSFGDEHINTSIRNAFLFNPNVQLQFISPDYSFSHGNRHKKILHLLTNVVPELKEDFKTGSDLYPLVDTEVFRSGRFILTGLTFKDYLDFFYEGEFNSEI
jgi:hypothetical protein